MKQVTTRSGDGGDTMKSHSSDLDRGVTTRFHGIRLEDRGSCMLPEPWHTITLREWREQQKVIAEAHA